MRDFHIWTRVAPLDGTDRFLAVVVAIPDGQGAGERSEAESRVYASRQQAVEGCAEMSIAMARRLEKRGNRISIIEAV